VTTFVDSPALSIAAQLQLQGAVVTVTDPKALTNAARRFPELHYVSDTATAVQKADALLLLTEWQEYRDLEPLRAGRVGLFASSPRRPECT